MNSEAPNQRFLRSTSPSVVVHPIFLQKTSKFSLDCLYFFCQGQKYKISWKVRFAPYLSWIICGIQSIATQSSLTHLLYAVTEFSSRELVPQTLNCGKVCGRNPLHISEIYEISTLFFGSRNDNESITSELGNDIKRELKAICKFIA